MEMSSAETLKVSVVASFMVELLYVCKYSLFPYRHPTFESME